MTPMRGGVGHRAVRHARYALTQSRRHSRSLFVSTPGTAAECRALWICSWQRSGSTWLAEMMCAAPHCRLVYEPANLCDGLVDGRDGASRPLPSVGSPAVADVVAALRGQRRGAWVDQLNHAHVVTHRVVKDVRALGIAGEVRATVPDCPIIILIRHPVDVATSAARLGWIAPSADAQLAEVASWCEVHAGAFADPRLGDVHVVAYENLRHDPDGTLAEIVNYAGTFDQSWRRLDRSRLDPARPSATQFATTESSPTEIEDVRVRGAALLAAHGLGSLYDDRPGCHGDPAAVGAALRRSVTS